jgi:hypothetical protein
MIHLDFSLEDKFLRFPPRGNAAHAQIPINAHQVGILRREGRLHRAYATFGWGHG